MKKYRYFDWTGLNLISFLKTNNDTYRKRISVVWLNRFQYLIFSILIGTTEIARNEIRQLKITRMTGRSEKISVITKSTDNLFIIKKISVLWKWLWKWRYSIENEYRLFRILTVLWLNRFQYLIFIILVATTEIATKRDSSTKNYRLPVVAKKISVTTKTNRLFIHNQKNIGIDWTGLNFISFFKTNNGSYDYRERISVVPNNIGSLIKSM